MQWKRWSDGEILREEKVYGSGISGGSSLVGESQVDWFLQTVSGNKQTQCHTKKGFVAWHRLEESM